MDFSKDFLWGASSAAYQIEGGWDADGKVPGIWDSLSSGHIKRGENGNNSAGHYFRYKEDVQNMKKMDLKAYRFSVSWPRVMAGRNHVNPAGLAFYRNLVEELTEANIEPVLTLYHWDLPMWVHEYGGWESADIIGDFAEYTKVVAEALKDKVKYWITINEPQCFVGAGYMVGYHAPFLEKPDKIKEIMRNVMLAHGRSVQVLREIVGEKAQIGFAPTGSGITPHDEGDIETAKRKTYSEDGGVMSNVWWMDPIILGRIPAGFKDVISQEDIKTICQPLDFFGVNIYNSNNHQDPETHSVYMGMPKNSMGWPITDDVLYWMAKFHYERYGLPIFITENGMPNTDFIMRDGKVHDPQRIDFISRYLNALKKAVHEGIPVIGYLYWSILDNFEWVEGYDPRFGLIYVDYRTGKRIWKDSAYFYSEVIRSNGLNI